MTSSLLQRVGLLAVGAAALGACDLAPLVSPDPASPGATVTVSNLDGPHCVVEEGDDGMPVEVVLITSIVELIESGEFDVVASVMTDEDAFAEA